MFASYSDETECFNIIDDLKRQLKTSNEKLYSANHSIQDLLSLLRCNCHYVTSDISRLVNDTTRKYLSETFKEFRDLEAEKQNRLRESARKKLTAEELAALGLTK